MQREKGITLIALIVTIVVLLILAGISINLLWGEHGILNVAKDAEEITRQAKAREILDLALSDAQMQKYEKGLTDEELDNKIVNIQGELLPKEDENSNNQQVIVEGHIFEIDRSVPKILDYIGIADGVIITSTVVSDESKAIITGIIKTYSGGNIKIVSAKRTVNETTTEIDGFAIREDGRYTIEVTEDTTITIEAKDSKEKTSTKTISARIKDITPPTVNSVTAKTEGVKIKINATGTDIGSGIKKFNYSVEPTEGVTEISGTFAPNEQAEITTTKYTTYTITVTATDKSGNVSLIGESATVETRNDNSRSKSQSQR